jgi:hypothetical protein
MTAGAAGHYPQVPGAEPPTRAGGTGASNERSPVPARRRAHSDRRALPVRDAAQPTADSAPSSEPEAIARDL